tara:strand:+ start:540 stop:1505 length:966 start_codon:yes stop_codon:yes gene_type:complete
MSIKVGVREKDPFIINNDKLSGFTIDIWQAIAKKHNIDFKYQVIKKKENIDTLIEENKFDVILGVLGLNPERIKNIDYTTPYYFTHYSIVSKKKDGTKAFITLIAKFTLLFFLYSIFAMTVCYFYAKPDVKIAYIIEYTFKNMSPYLSGRRSPGFLAKLNYFFGIFFIISLLINLYSQFFIKDQQNKIPKKPIVVDSNSGNLIKYLKSRGAQVKLVDNKSGKFENLLDMYLNDTENLAGVFVSEEGKIHKDGSLFNKDPKYQNLKFGRYNFGQSQVSLLVKKDHPLYETINGELIRMRETGEIYTLSKNWLNAAHNKQLRV